MNSDYIYGFEAEKLKEPGVLEDFLKHLDILKASHGPITIMLLRPAPPCPVPVHTSASHMPLYPEYGSLGRFSRS